MSKIINVDVDLFPLSGDDKAAALYRLAHRLRDSSVVGVGAAADICDYLSELVKAKYPYRERGWYSIGKDPHYRFLIWDGQQWRDSSGRVQAVSSDAVIRPLSFGKPE